MKPRRFILAFLERSDAACGSKVAIVKVAWPIWVGTRIARVKTEGFFIVS
jgi:hypothetical protein